MHSNSQTKTASPTQLAQAFDKYYPAIFRYFRLRGADPDTANDLTASVFERALSRIHQYDPHKAQIQTWLFAIAHNLSINHWKSQKETIPLDDELPDGNSPLEEVVIGAQDKEQVLSMLQTLDSRSREIIALKFGGELTNREIAAMTKLSGANVGVILYRSLLKLQNLLADPQWEARHER